MLHVVVVCMQVHAVVLQSVEPMHDMRTARIDIAVAVLFFWRRLVKYGVASFSLLRILRLTHSSDLSGLFAIGIEVLKIPLYLDKAV